MFFLLRDGLVLLRNAAALSTFGFSGLPELLFLISLLSSSTDSFLLDAFCALFAINFGIGVFGLACFFLGFAVFSFCSNLNTSIR